MSVTTDSGRARLPDTSGSRRRRGLRGDRLRGLRLGRPDDCLPALDADHPLAAVEGPGPVPQPLLPRGDVRRAKQRPIRSPDAGFGLPAGARRQRPRNGDECDRDLGRRPGRPAWRRRLAGDPVAASQPSRALGIVGLAVGIPLLSSPHPRPVAHRSRTSSTPTKAGPSSTATTGSATTPASRSPSSARSRRSRTRRRRSRTQ